MIEFSHVSKIYPNGVKAMDDVNLKIEQGEFVGIIGLSGAGKSTLIRTVNKMIDTTEGTLTVNGIDVSKLKGKELRKFRRKIGMVFQSFNLVSRTSVINNVLSAKVADMSLLRTLFGLYSKKDKIEALEALDKVGILDKAYIRADQLSGGQMQRVALARTLAQNPEIILADEPTASLDSKRGRDFVEMLAHEVKSRNKAAIMVTHDERMLDLCDRVVNITDGKVFG